MIPGVSRLLAYTKPRKKRYATNCLNLWLRLIRRWVSSLARQTALCIGTSLGAFRVTQSLKFGLKRQPADACLTLAAVGAAGVWRLVGRDISRSDLILPLVPCSRRDGSVHSS